MFFFSCKTDHNIPRVHNEVFFLEFKDFYFPEFLSMAIKLHILEYLTKYSLQECSQLPTKSGFMICVLCNVRVASERELESEQNL